MLGIGFFPFGKLRVRMKDITTATLERPCLPCLWVRAIIRIRVEWVNRLFRRVRFDCFRHHQ